MPLRDSPDDRDGPRRRRGDVRPSWSSTCSCPPSAAAARRARRLRGRSTLGGARLAFSTDSFVVRPLFFPGGCIGDLAVNGTVNDLAMSGARAAVPVGGVHPGGGHRRWPTSAGSPTALGAAARGRRRRGWSPATPRWSTPATATGSTSTPPASGWSPTASTSGPQRAVPGDVVIVSGDIGVHGVAVMSVPRGPGVRHRDRERQRAAARPGRRRCSAHRRRPARAARPDPRRRWPPRSTRSPRPPASASSSWSATCPIPPTVAQRLRPARASTRCTSPTRASWSRSCRASDADAVLAAMRAHPLGRGGGGRSASASRSTPAWWWPAPALGGTRVVDLPIGEQLPRIC